MEYTLEDFIADLKKGNYMIDDWTECALLDDFDDTDDIRDFDVAIWPVYDHHDVEILSVEDTYEQYIK